MTNEHYRYATRKLKCRLMMNKLHSELHWKKLLSKDTDARLSKNEKSEVLQNLCPSSWQRTLGSGKLRTDTDSNTIDQLDVECNRFRRETLNRTQLVGSCFRTSVWQKCELIRKSIVSHEPICHTALALCLLCGSGGGSGNTHFGQNFNMCSHSFCTPPNLTRSRPARTAVVCGD